MAIKIGRKDCKGTIHRRKNSLYSTFTDRLASGGDHLIIVS